MSDAPETIVDTPLIDPAVVGEVLAALGTPEGQADPYPHYARLRELDVKHASVDNLFDRNFAIIALDHLRPMIELLDQTADRVPTSPIHSIDLVQHNNIRKLDLINHEIRHSPFILRSNIVATRGKQIHSLEIMKHRERINHGASRIQASELLEPTRFLQALEHRYRALVQAIGS